MRLMIDTQIFVFLAQDVLSLSHDVRELLSDYSNTLHISAESVKELIVAYNNKRLFTNKWKSAEDMVAAIEDELARLVKEGIDKKSLLAGLNFYEFRYHH